MDPQFVLQPAPAPAAKSVTDRVNAWAGRLLKAAAVGLFWWTWDALFRWPRAAVVAYTVAWNAVTVSAGVDLTWGLVWLPGHGWWTLLLAATHPVTVAAGVAVWWHMTEPEAETLPDGRVVMWNQGMASPHEGTWQR